MEKKMEKTISLIPILAGYACSECGVHYSHWEYETYYSRYPLNCKMCGAVFGKMKPEEYKQLSFFEE